jgi:hypothetical protein
MLMSSNICSLMFKKKMYHYCTHLHLCCNRGVVTHESTHGGLSFKRECSSLVEDAPTSTKHGRRRHVMGIVRGMVWERYLSKGIH